MTKMQNRPNKADVQQRKGNVRIPSHICRVPLEQFFELENCSRIPLRLFGYVLCQDLQVAFQLNCVGTKTRKPISLETLCCDTAIVFSDRPLRVLAWQTLEVAMGVLPIIDALDHAILPVGFRFVILRTPSHAPERRLLLNDGRVSHPSGWFFRISS